MIDYTSDTVTLNFMHGRWRIEIDNDAQKVRTIFDDIGEIVAAPEDTEEYRARAQSLGYGDNTWLMCRDHELMHSWIAACSGLNRSPVLLSVAHDTPMSEDEAHPEECAVLGMQRYFRHNGLDVLDVIMAAINK